MCGRGGGRKTTERPKGRERKQEGSINRVVQRSVSNGGGRRGGLSTIAMAAVGGMGGWEGSGGHWSNQVGGSWLSDVVSSVERQAGTVMRIMTS